MDKLTINITPRINYAIIAIDIIVRVLLFVWFCQGKIGSWTFLGLQAAVSFVEFIINMSLEEKFNAWVKTQLNKKYTENFEINSSPDIHDQLSILYWLSTTVAFFIFFMRLFNADSWGGNILVGLLSVAIGIFGLVALFIASFPIKHRIEGYKVTKKTTS